MTHHLSPDIRQHDTHGELVGQADSPVAPLPSPALDAIIVPASRPARHLEHAVTLAETAGCRLVVLCSRQARGDEVNQLLASRSLTEAVAIDLPPGYAHRWLEFATSRPQKIGELPEACAARDSDLSIKRNVGLILARMLGWDRVFFMDDDITNVGVDALHRTVSMLGPRYYSVGMRVTDFPDNSVVCHAHRATGKFQDVLVSGSVLAIDCTVPIGFFPDVYNEDWLFFYDDAAEHRLGCSGVSATQLRYDPFDDPQRAARQEFGDVLAEGLYALLHRGQTTAYATLDYWINFRDARRGFLDAIIARANRAPAEVRQNLLNSVLAARECTAQIQPEYCEHYVRLWRKDLGRWQQTLKELPRVSSITKALSELGLELGGDDGGGVRQAPQTDLDASATSAPESVTIESLATYEPLPVHSEVLAHLKAMAVDAVEVTLQHGVVRPCGDMAAPDMAAVGVAIPEAEGAAAGEGVKGGSRLTAAGMSFMSFMLLAAFLGCCLIAPADIAVSRPRYTRHRRAPNALYPWCQRSLQAIAARREAARTLSSRIRWHPREARVPTGISS